MTGDQIKAGNELLELALDRSARARFVLAASISDLFSAREDRLSTREKALIDDILGRLVRAFEMELRGELARRLAAKPRVPRSLILMLANDRIEVARPVLLASKILRTPDLVAIVRRHGEAHQIAVAGRGPLNEEVSAALVDSANVVVIETLLRNREARISEQTMAHLVEEAKWVESYREPLALRPDLPPELAGKLYRLVSKALRQHILENFDVDPETLDAELDPLVELRSDAAPRDLKGDLLEDAGPSLPVPSIYEQLVSMQEISPQLLIRVLRRGETSLFLSLFRQLTRLPGPNLQRVLNEPSGKAFAIVCRALDMAKSDFAIILFLTRQSRAGGLLEDPRDVARLMEYFERVPTAEARQRLARWREQLPDPDDPQGGPEEADA